MILKKCIKSFFNHQSIASSEPTPLGPMILGIVLDIYFSSNPVKESQAQWFIAPQNQWEIVPKVFEWVLFREAVLGLGDFRGILCEDFHIYELSCFCIKNEIKADSRNMWVLDSLGHQMEVASAEGSPPGCRTLVSSKQFIVNMLTGQVACWWECEVCAQTLALSVLWENTAG